MKKLMIGLFIVLSTISLTALASPSHTVQNQASAVVTVHHSSLSKLDGCK
jgi:hypothetical protein